MTARFGDLIQGYLAGGLSLVPCGKDKRPTVKWKEFQTRQPTIIELRHWLAEGAQSFAAIGGQVSGGLEIIDFDDNPQAKPLAYAAVDLFEAWREEVGSLVEQYKLVVQRTGGGGFQVAYRCPTPDPNQKLAWVQDETQEQGRSIAIETRGEGGYAIVAPSLHPSGNRYRMIYGDFADVPVIPQEIRNRLLDAARALDLMPYTVQELVTAKQEKKHTTRQDDSEQVSVIDTFNANHKIGDILARYGYTRGGHGRYSRPGKEESLGVAILDTDNVSFHWSSNDPLHKTNASGKPLPVDPFDVHVVMEHKGNVREATKDAAAKLGIKRKIHTNGNHKTEDAPDWAVEPATGDKSTLPKSDQNSTEEKKNKETGKAFLLTEGISDEGNAHCLNQLYANRFLYTDALGWLHYTGQHWTAKGADAAVNRAIVDTLAARIKAALKDDPEKHEKLIKFCIPNKGRVQGAMYLLQSLVAADIDEFDAEPDLLNCKNGVVDLRTGVLVPHNPTQRFTHCTNVDYKPNADSAPFLNWIIDAVEGGKETVSWLQMAIGYSLTGHTREEVLFYLYGPPRSGKGTLTEMLLALLGGTLAKEVNFGTFTAQRTGDSQNFDLAPLKPCRMVMASESNQYERFNEAKVKMLTGGNEVYCAFKHQTHFGYRPQYKIWLSSNQTVNADPDDDAVWGRLRVIVFPYSHLGSEDKTLKHGMRSTVVLEGALTWAVEGAKLWYSLGKAGLPELATSARAKDEHRSELDNVQAWIEEHCEQSDTFCSNATLYQSYEDWCKYRGVEPKKQKGFSQALIRKGYTNKIAKNEGKMIRGFMGLRVL